MAQGRAYGPTGAIHVRLLAVESGPDWLASYGNVDGHIWVEHGVENMLRKVLKPHVDQLSEGSDDDNIDDDDDDDDDGGMRFDDNEEERTCEQDEGFMQVVVERPTNINRVEVNMK
ncbi:hypothetical protein KIW84_071359 [Lathyrus oleraceus]|uniref:Uncharacterized protein n=1 Tax=Pisum sativum TaxID=3888 RepID=A0A9D4VKC2_PEA|nr:hypothetical protein KIW84_071359 [Pisum sativum]